MSDYFEEQNKAVDAPEDVTESSDDQNGNELSSEQSTKGSDESLEQVETTQTDISDTGKTVKDEDKQEEQKLYTKDELDATAAKIKAIYEKKLTLREA